MWQTVAKDKVIAQSIRAGSDVSNGSTVTVTLSNGKQTSTVTPTPTPQPVCNEVHVYIYDELLDPENPTNTCSKIKSRYPTLKFNYQYVYDSGLTNGILKNSASVDDTIKTTCDTILLQIVKN